MSATSRLFSIIQTLRAAKKPITARQLCVQLEVSLRTIYRDIAELQAQNVPVEGEAGIGYVLRKGYDMPPLMLTPDELEAALLGAQWVAERGDTKLADGANNLIAKLNDVIPRHLKPFIESSVVAAPCLKPAIPDNVDPERLREAMRLRKKIEIEYVDGADRISKRIIWPFMLAYLETAKLVVAWCEKRKGFRHFRTDRIMNMNVLDEKFPTTTDKLKLEWWEKEKEKPRFYAKDELS
ncbi:MAG TPA: YafY family transcriptional regulator [Colwellia sp.]|nr:YafY family transcriptional regulator [Colwellia sp.]